MVNIFNFCLDKNENVECSYKSESSSSLSLSQKQTSLIKQAETLLILNQGAFLNDIKTIDDENSESQNSLTKKVSIFKNNIHRNSCFPVIVVILIN